MNSEWQQYLNNIGLGSVLIERVEKIIEFYAEVANIDPDYLFVSEYQDLDQSRNFESVWLCSEHFFCEAKDFTKVYDCDYVPFIGKYKQWSASYKDFDWKSATEDSRLTIEFALESGIYGKLQASGRNCDQLAQFLVRYIKPYLSSSLEKRSLDEDS